MVIIILDEFFIRFSDFLINVFIRLIDYIVLFMNKLGNGRNNENIDSSKDGSNHDYFEDEIAINEKEIFSLGNILKKDSIFDEFERQYYDNSSFDDFNSFKKSDNIFASLNMENDVDSNNSSENESNHQNKFLEGMKEKSINFLMNNRFIRIDRSNFLSQILKIFFILSISFIFIVALVTYFISLELGLAILLSFILTSFFILYYPKIKRQNDYSSFSKELPYALRQLATELRAGKSLFDSLDSIAYSDYGVLSLEFSRVLEEIKYGESTENAFLNMERRVDSKALSRVIYEILTSLRIGSNLSGSLSVIADDVNFDIRMKLKEYSEKLNAFIMIYTFLAILAPVIILTMLLAASVVIGDLVPGDLVLILYGVFFPMIIIFLGFAIKILEPKI